MIFPASNQKEKIARAMKLIEAETCVRFLIRQNQKDYILIKTSKKGCSSHLGKIGGTQNLYLNSKCFKVGNIAHELIHALGYAHMHNHVHRGKYVTIYWDNIQPQHRSNFQKVNLKQFGNFKTPYDYRSIMHFGLDTFSKRKGKVTIVPRNPKYTNIIGQRKKLSKGDKKRINGMYKCSARFN